MCPSAVFDADGQQIVAPIVGFDVDTGVIERQMLNSNGRPVIDRAKGEIATYREEYKAPLTLKKLTPDEASEFRRRCMEIATSQVSPDAIVDTANGPVLR